MDEPRLLLRDGAYAVSLPLTEVLQIQTEASAMAAGAHKGDPEAIRAVETVKQIAEQPGPNRARSRLFAFLIDWAWQQIEAVKMRNMITVPAQQVAGEVSPPPSPSAAPAPRSAPCPLPHPDDVACAACAGGWAARKAERDAQATKQQQNGASA